MTVPTGGGALRLRGDRPNGALWDDTVFPARPMARVSADPPAVWLDSPAQALIGRGDHPTGLPREHEIHEALSALPGAAKLDASFPRETL
ncbi:hypothetical protein ACFY2H_08350 [Streptomyces griseofuscus]|uniref:hypothetical protein n=1 Tax=Streptomyces griseofuscus TaxID=146922 RepID=UPI0036CF46DD